MSWHGLWLTGAVGGLLIGALGGLIASVALVATAYPRHPRPRARYLRRRLAWLTAMTALFVYSVGVFDVASVEHDHGSAVAACPTHLDPAEISHYRSSYLPLRSECVLTDGTAHGGDPDLGLITVTALVLVLTAAALAVGRDRMTALSGRLAARRDPAWR
ncbi:hypothetical protein [Streptomyces mayteni]